MNNRLNVESIYYMVIYLFLDVGKNNPETQGGVLHVLLEIY